MNYVPSSRTSFSLHKFNEPVPTRIANNPPCAQDHLDYLTESQRLKHHQDLNDELFKSLKLHRKPLEKSVFEKEEFQRTVKKNGKEPSVCKLVEDFGEKRYQRTRTHVKIEPPQEFKLDWMVD
ncbi:Hypothetical_protein [Hexamita inflata]|uniref:Hypothetical_protein n=1 Tax=Hexamita inflata TaxID=28002 RepID=A0AA86UC92_9EUKA|nr:Hypothetical protein HINF_LOCUS24123 [Hexamita inflata]